MYNQDIALAVSFFIDRNMDNTDWADLNGFFPTLPNYQLLITAH